MKVLLFGTMGDIGPWLMRHLQGVGHQLSLVDFPQNTFRDFPGYRRELLKAIRSFVPDAVVPVGNPIAMSRLKGELAALFPGLSVEVESPEKIELLDSKTRLYAYAQSLGIPQPRCFASADDVPAGVRTVFKRDVSFAAHGVRIPADIDGLRNVIAHHKKGEPYLIEEFIEGREYSVDVLRRGGECFVSSYESVRGRASADSCRAADPAVERHPVAMPALEAIAVRILESLDYNGVCGFDFIVDADGNPYLLEANPRFTGGLATQLSVCWPPAHWLLMR